MLFVGRSVRAVRSLSLQLIFVPGAAFLALLASTADFNPGWARYVAFVGVAAGLAVAVIARFTRLVNSRFTTQVVVTTMALTTLIGLSIQPPAIGVLTAFVFLGIAVGSAAFLRLRTATLASAACTLLGLVVILSRSSVPVVASTIFLALMTITSIVVIVLRQSLQAARDEAIALSLTDSLTGLANRRSMEANIPVMIALAERTGQHVGCLLLDIDLFKVVNDTLGHETGDEVLKTVAAVLRDTTRESDVCVRIGGDEFCVFTVVTSRDDLQHVAERVRVAIDRLPSTPHLTVSVGGAVTSFEVGRMHAGGELDELLRQADSALYLAKAAGRNLVKIG
jgi:diguanylate cyclase (GGDEF)-like protein